MASGLPRGRPSADPYTEPVNEREILIFKAQADTVLDRAALQLQQLLKEACAKLDEDVAKRWWRLRTGRDQRRAELPLPTLQVSATPKCSA